MGFYTKSAVYEYRRQEFSFEEIRLGSIEEEKLRPRRYGTTGTHRGSRQASPARKQRGLPLRLGCFASSWIAAVVKHKNKPHHERARVGLFIYACLVAYAPILTTTSTSFLEASNGITVVPVSVCPSTTSSFTPFSILSGFSTLIL